MVLSSNPEFKGQRKNKIKSSSIYRKTLLNPNFISPSTISPERAALSCLTVSSSLRLPGREDGLLFRHNVGQVSVRHRRVLSDEERGALRCAIFFRNFPDAAGKKKKLTVRCGSLAVASRGKRRRRRTGCRRRPSGPASGRPRWRAKTRPPPWEGRFVWPRLAPT